MKEQDKEVVIDTKLMHFGLLHKFVQNGGSIKFNNYPFGIRITGNGTAFVEVSLFAVPSGTSYTGHINPTAPKKQKEIKKIEVQEEDEIEM